MTRETKSAYPINANSPSSKDDSAFEQFGKKLSEDSASSGVSENCDSAFISDKASILKGRERESHNQREAIIRPQQAGKIDFKSLQSRPKYSSDATWTNNKSNPLSPTGKNRGKEKHKRSGKGDRNQHQLYRLSISSSRSNPTIGIAYPQQKVTPPKKPELSQGSIPGSYRFNVTNVPGREGEVHQEERHFNRSHPEPSSSLTSTSYTSQTVPASRIPQGLKIQPGNPHDTANSSGQLHYLEFQQNGNTWHPSDKHFTGTSGYVISNQKVCSFAEGNKTDYGNVSFPYPFPSMQEQGGNTFCNNGSNQDFVDVVLAANQVAHNTYSFQSSREGPEDPQGSGSYNTVLPDNRTYVIPSQQAPFLHTQQGVQPPPTPPCYTGHNDHVSDHNGAISSPGAFSSSGATEKNQSTFQENQSIFNPSEFSLHNNSMPTLINKRQQPSKDFVHSQRLLTPGSTLRRNIPQTSLNKVHFPGKVYSSVNTGSVPFDKNVLRIPQTWDAGNDNFSSLDQNSVPYPNAPGNILPYQCQPNEQRQVLKTQRTPWQQSQNTPSTTNHIELSRNFSGQKPYTLSNSDWQNNNLMTKIPPSYHTKKHLVVEASPTPRAEMTRQNYSSNEILYDNSKDTNDARTKSISYGVSQPIQQSRNSNQPVPLSGKSFVPESSYESPLPSPVTNPISGSTCSSLSPMSSSPVNPDENQGPQTLTSTPYFRQPCHPAEKPYTMSDSISSGMFLYPNSEPTKTYNYLAEPSKDEHTFKNLPEHQYRKITDETSKGCVENFESEPPPPYSSHHFLASSLSSANLDQLDVLLTCKQCDQNFGNLSSFLEHRQYCNLNSTVQTEVKDSSHGGDIRKSTVDSLKASPILQGISLPKAQTEFNSHLTGFSKDYLLESDPKGDGKEDPIKGNILHNASFMPLTACETLEMDEAKLDSLIIEALNGLEFQADNPELDSTFIDVFVDDDLATAKAGSNSQKVKENKETTKRLNVEQKQVHHNSISYTSEEKYDTNGSQSPKNAIKMLNEQKCPEIGSGHKHSLDTNFNNSKNNIKASLESCKWQKSDDSTRNSASQEIQKTIKNKADLENIDCQDKKGRKMKNDPHDFDITETSKSRKVSLKDPKKKKAHNGTWSKELIHKIVQQKNKLHKLHVKSNKNGQFSLVTERLYPPTKTQPFGEYDYISDSEDEFANSLPQNMPNGRMKFNFNRDIQGRVPRTKIKEPIWRMGEATRFQLQSKDLRNTKKEISNRIRRRNSQSSNSSDQSTSISSETGSSPKSTERTDSENDQECVPRCKTFSTQLQNNTERNFIKPILREDLPETVVHPDLTKGAKRFGSAKFLLTSSKVQQKINEIHYKENEKHQQTTDSSNKSMSKTSGTDSLRNAEEDRLSTYQKEMAASTLSQDNYTSKLMVNIDVPPQQNSSFNVSNNNYQEKQLNSIPSEINPTFCDDNVKYVNNDICNVSKDFPISISCYNADPSVPSLTQQNDKSYLGECQQYQLNKDVNNLCRNNIFSNGQNGASIDIENIYGNQNNNLHSFENKFSTSELVSYPSDNNENKVSSGLSFDSASIFAEIPISDFETTLYNDETAPKDNYTGFNQSSKPSNFEQQYPEFLQEKSWDLIGGISMSSDNVAPFHVQDNQAAEKYVEHIPVASEQITTISEYNVPFINNVSEDELEIKRLVTELESQLQTSKVLNDTSKPLPKDQFNQELTESALTLPDTAVKLAESCRNNAYFNEIPNNVHNPKHATPQLLDSQPLAKVDRSCENLRNSWTSAVQFDSFTSDIQCHKQTSMLNDTSIKDAMDPLGNNNSPSANISDEGLPNLSSQITCPRYPQHDISRTLVLNKAQFGKNDEHKAIHETESQQKNITNLATIEQKAERTEEQYDDPPKLEPVQSVENIDSEFDVQDNSHPASNMTDTPLHRNSLPEERLCDQQLPITSSDTAANTDYNKKITMHNKEGLQDSTKQKDFVLLDMPVLVKEENAMSEKSLISKESSENPLQQLQLFVARTAKNNEEDMLMPCFPMLLVASSVSDSKVEEESHVLCTVETTSIGESEKMAKLVEQNELLKPSESSTERIKVDEIGSNSCTFVESLSNEAHEAKDANLKECPELHVLNVCTDGLRNEPNSLPSEMQVEDNVTPPLKKGKPTSTCIPTFDNEAYTSSKITCMLIDMQKYSSDISEAGNLETGTREAEITKMAKPNDKTTGQSSKLFLGTDNKKEPSSLGDDNCNGTANSDTLSTHFPLPPNADEALCDSNNDYETHLLSMPTAHSMLSFDLLSHAPLKKSILPQKPLYTSTDGLELVEMDSLCKTSEKCQNEQELTNNLMPAINIQPYLYKGKPLALDNNQELVEEKVLLEPVGEGNITPCFCSELVCIHYKSQHQDSVTDLILGCQSTPTNDNFPVYNGENTNFLALQNDIFPEGMQTTIEPTICNFQDEANKCDWKNMHKGSNREHSFPNEEDRSSSTECNLMGIAEQKFVEYSCQKPTEKTAAPFTGVTGLHNTDVEKVSIDEADNRCNSDMHSVIDGVLRILEGDKSKEILQSIGISPKSSPMKEKKSVVLSLTCDICSVSFRSKPGLTRHKAVKHNGSLASQKDAVISVKPLNMKNAASEWNIPNDSQHNLDPTSQNLIGDLLNPETNLQSQILIPEEEQILTAKNSEDIVSSDLVSKNRLNGKDKKRKRKPSNKSTNSQIPSDDVLNILKTNILKAIGHSNSLNSSDMGVEQSLNKDKALTDISSQNVSTETYSTAITIDDDEKLVSDVLDMEMNGDSLLQEQKWVENLNNHNEHIINDSKMQPVETVSNDQCLSGEEEHLTGTSQVQKDVELSHMPKETVTDFHIFFDDDNTFSQLFPRDDHFIRRKCTRVYGKRNKRQTPTFESDFKHTDIMEQSHTTQINYSNDYGNISLESALDGHFPSHNDHLPHYQHHRPSMETPEEDEAKMLSFVSQNQENINVSFLDRTENEIDKGVPSHITLYKPSAESSGLSVEMSPDTSDSQTLDIFSCNASDDADLPEVPTIDMKMLSTKFDMRELSFFSACGDDSDQSDLETTDINQMPEKHKKNGKVKVNDKKQSKNHNTKMKSKDKQYKCKVCFQWFLTLGELDFHKLTHNPSPPPTCYMCVQRKFSSREQLRDHLKDKHAKNKAGLWICGMCLKEISDVWMYNEHLREHATQFARKGQAQKSVMGIPGCFGGNSMVRTFLSTFIYRTPSTLSKIPETDDKGLLTKRQDQKEHKCEEEAIGEKEPDNFIHVVPSAPIPQIKPSVSPSMDSSQKSESISKNATMHPHCKDPSRDCHHCGKQFPKPFKLQRHLVVHSLQKIYLCHKCPKSYQEAQELRNHLNSEHQLTEKSEIKHTTLYACELCADVMHVIKKSFICSTCNYTFSKKEQYDRHMEKHLIGGSMTFKFRGVTRPTNSGKALKMKMKDFPAHDDMPPSKKLKTSTYSPTYEDVESSDHIDLSQCPKLSPGGIFEQIIEHNLRNKHESTVKIEEILMDAPLLQAEGKEEQTNGIAEECLLSPTFCNERTSKKDDDGLTSETETMIESAAYTERNICSPQNNAEYCDSTNLQRDGPPEYKVDEPADFQTALIKADLALLNSEEPQDFFTSVKTMEPSNDSPLELQVLLLKDVDDDKEETSGSLIKDGNKTLALHSTNENVLVSDCNLKETNASQAKTARKDLTENFSKNNTDFKILDKMSEAICTKLHQKKRKEHKISDHKANAASQENLVKKKKAKVAVTGKSESSVNAKKSECISSSLDTKEETPAIRPHPKPANGGVCSNFKKTVLDTYNQRKLNSQLMGDYKNRRTPVAKSKGQFSPKSCTLSSNSPSNKRKIGHNTKPSEPSNYRTAESQNHLLSQLFGQKLTSFKIPLRRDITE